jgi:hypothetical protein
MAYRQNIPNKRVMVSTPLGGSILSPELIRADRGDQIGRFISFGLWNLAAFWA